MLFGQLSLEPREAVAVPFAAAAVLADVLFQLLQRKDRQLTRCLQVALAMLVMDRQRLDRELTERRQLRVSLRRP